jgi:hypothetical protein
MGAIEIFLKRDGTRQGLDDLLHVRDSRVDTLRGLACGISNFKFWALDRLGQRPVFFRYRLGRSRKAYLRRRAVLPLQSRPGRQQFRWPHCRSHAGVPVPVRLFRR